MDAFKWIASGITGRSRPNECFNGRGDQEEGLGRLISGCSGGHASVLSPMVNRNDNDEQNDENDEKNVDKNVAPTENINVTDKNNSAVIRTISNSRQRLYSNRQDGGDELERIATHSKRPPNFTDKTPRKKTKVATMSTPLPNNTERSPFVSPELAQAKMPSTIGSYSSNSDD
jgi:hypothetical protein